MYLSNIHRKNFVAFYFFCFAAIYCWLFYKGILIHQLKPVFFLNRLDLSLNLLFLTNIQNAVIKSYALQWFLDALFFLLPLLLLLSNRTNSKYQYRLAIINAVFNFVYTLLLSSFSVLSIEGFLGWILLPLIFVWRSDRLFYYALHCMRYIFLIVFFSAGLWKLRAGGFFNIEEMSAILVKQHTAYMIDAPANWFTQLLSYLINHQSLSYCLYCGATIAELIFAIGFFTKKYDRWLITIFLLFVVFNLVLMRINYLAWAAFLGCLWFSKYAEPQQEEEKTATA